MWWIQTSNFKDNCNYYYYFFLKVGQFDWIWIDIILREVGDQFHNQSPISYYFHSFTRIRPIFGPLCRLYVGVLIWFPQLRLYTLLMCCLSVWTAKNSQHSLTFCKCGLCKSFLLILTFLCFHSFNLFLVSSQSFDNSVPFINLICHSCTPSTSTWYERTHLHHNCHKTPHFAL